MAWKWSKNQQKLFEEKVAQTHREFAETDWSKGHPHGMYFYYKGDDWEAFANQMIEKFGFDPRANCLIQFFVPPKALNEYMRQSYSAVT